MFAQDTHQTSKTFAAFAPVQSELLNRLDKTAEALAEQPTPIFPLTPAQVRDLVS